MNVSVWREAFDELWRRKLRTLLTLLGLIFGVGAIVAMLAVGEGSRQEALRLVEGLGLNNLIVEAKTTDNDALRELRMRSLGLNVADAEAALAVVPGANAWSAEKDIRTFSVFSEHGVSDARASGISAEHLTLNALHLAQGRGFTTEDELSIAEICVLGHQAARSLFPAGDALGQPVKVNHVWLRVVGVLADRDLSAEQFEGVQLGLESNRVFVPLATARARFRFQPMEDDVDRIVLRLDDPERVAAASQVLAAMLERRHGGQQDYSLIVPARLYHQHQQTQRIFQFVMAAIAAISLLVGGIGIMNTMLANVLERRREIGLLRALGARRRDIIEQFLRETGVICFLGALLGLLLGAALAYLIGSLAGWPVGWDPLPVLLSSLGCAAIGMLFGVYPARQAAALDPITALRSD